MEAVESAVVKIQSTFRGKKFRSKLNHKQESGLAGEQTTDTKGSTIASQKPEGSSKINKESVKAEERELNEKLSTMQVNDKTTSDDGSAREPQKANVSI